MKTDIIDDSLSPRWMPWTKRAFIFRITHTSSPIYLAVFDHDASIMDDHDFIGRVVLDMTNLRPGAEYILEYNLQQSSLISEKELYESKPRYGTITVRLRIDYDDQRRVILSSLQPPPRESVLLFQLICLYLFQCLPDLPIDIFVLVLPGKV